MGVSLKLFQDVLKEAGEIGVAPQEFTCCPRECFRPNQGEVRHGLFRAVLVLGTQFLH